MARGCSRSASYRPGTVGDGMEYEEGGDAFCRAGTTAGSKSCRH
jgi:hypothetical protein